MEGKCLLFKSLAGLTPYRFASGPRTSGRLSGSSSGLNLPWGVNLEDISAPRCFEIEASKKTNQHPHFHDDQHGTAVVVLAALLTPKVVGKNLRSVRIVVSGAGAASCVPTCFLLRCAGCGHERYL